jgi:hypothetical protein
MKHFRFRFKSKEITTSSISITIDRGELFNCKLSSNNFRGKCNINGCHANIPGIHQSNCIFLFFDGKTELDKFDLMYALKLTEKRLRDQSNIGRKCTHDALLLYNILSRLKINSRINFCQRCGVIRTTKGDCINKTECDNRIVFATKFISSSYLNFEEMKAKYSDVFLLLHNKEKLEETISKINESINVESAKTNLSSLFGIIDDRILADIENIKTIV